MASSPKHIIKKKKLSKKQKIIIVSIIVGVIVALGAAAVIYANILLNTSFEDEEALKAKDQLTETSFDSPFYMVLVGTDTREGDRSNYSLEQGRSDTCLLARIDPVNYQVTLVSIPRDTQIELNGSTEKFNAAFSYGGISSTIEQAKKITGVEISHYAEISFNGMTDLINAVGGVDIYVPEAVNDFNTEVYVPQGQQHLNGEQALSFARTRQFADGDFTRTEDQRSLLKALMEKALKMNITDMPNLMKAAKKFIKTDFTLGEMIGLANKFKDENKLVVYSAMLPATTGTVGGASYVFLDKDSVQRMMKMVDRGEDPSMIQVPDGVSVGSARTQADTLAKQEEYYKQHPDSPGKLTITTNETTN